MEKKDYINRIEDLTAEQISDAISRGILTFEELKITGAFGHDLQKSVKALLTKKDDDAFSTSNTLEEMSKYLLVFPAGNHSNEVQARIKQILDKKDIEDKRRKENEKMLQKVKDDINEYDTDDIIKKLSPEDLGDLCNQLGLDVNLIKNYREPVLKHNNIPKCASDIPAGYTDVFFWGIPSSGKTCALSAIFSTIKKDFSMEAPDCDQKFGATYRDSLINIFQDGYGYLPGRTSMDKTQYMPFLFYRRGEKKRRKISFFELSGEVFKYFYDVANNTSIINDFNREVIEKAFQTLELLLKSNNQKVHFFFIDYNQETKHTVDSNGLNQSNYLEAAATYLRDAKDEENKPVDIFKKKTDAVYVVVTKSDEIRGHDRASIASSFLYEHFGSFMDVLENQCRKHSVDFNVKLFSIGNVYFKKICKINRSYSTDIINDLLNRIRPVNDSAFRNIFNS